MMIYDVCREMKEIALYGALSAVYDGSATDDKTRERVGDLTESRLYHNIFELTHAIIDRIDSISLKATSLK